MATTEPIEVYGEISTVVPGSLGRHLIVFPVDVPETLDFDSVRSCLKRIVPLCLDSDPSLIPISCQEGDDGVDTDSRDPDDFLFWSERQARRISIVIEQAFGVEYVPAVIISDANLTALANRIVVSNVDSES
jgi:phosphatidylethanolamine N-methyltransferase